MDAGSGTAQGDEGAAPRQPPSKRRGRRTRAMASAIRTPRAKPAATRTRSPAARRSCSCWPRPTGRSTAEALALQLSLTAPDRFDALSKRLGAMLRDGQLLQNRKGAYAPARAAGPDRRHRDRQSGGFRLPAPGSSATGVGDDLFLPPFEMRKAMHGDRVLASVTGVDRRGRREGAIVEVLERRLTRLIGRFTLEVGHQLTSVPDDRRIQRNVQIPPDARLDAKHGQLVVCRDRAGARCAPPADRPRARGAGRQADRLAGGRGRDPRPRDSARIPAGSARRGRGGPAAGRCRDRGVARRPAQHCRW